MAARFRDTTENRFSRKGWCNRWPGQGALGVYEMLQCDATIADGDVRTLKLAHCFYQHRRSTRFVMSLLLGGFSPRPRACSDSWMMRQAERSEC